MESDEGAVEARGCTGKLDGAEGLPEEAGRGETERDA